MGIFSWIVIGLLAGILAKWIMPGNQNAGFFVTTALGIAGGLLGGFVMSLLGGGGMDEFSLTNLLVATLGALVVLFAYSLLKKAR